MTTDRDEMYLALIGSILMFIVGAVSLMIGFDGVALVACWMSGFLAAVAGHYWLSQEER